MFKILLNSNANVLAAALAFSRCKALNVLLMAIVAPMTKSRKQYKQGDRILNSHALSSSSRAFIDITDGKRTPNGINISTQHDAVRADFATL